MLRVSPALPAHNPVGRVQHDIFDRLSIRGTESGRAGGAHLGSDSNEQIALANKLAGREPTRFAS